MTKGEGTKERPWHLTTASGSSEYTMWRDDAAGVPVIVCLVGMTELRYQARAMEDRHAWLKEQGDWVPPENTVEAWGRSPKVLSEIRGAWLVYCALDVVCKGPHPFT
jgi:hypothetical protein